MTERTLPFYESTSIRQQEPDPLGLTHSDLELDWELQRLLGEELSAMAPAPTPVTPVADAVTDHPSLHQPEEALSRQWSDPSSSTGARVVSAIESEFVPEPAATSWDIEKEPKIAAMAESLSVEVDALYQQMTREVGALNAPSEEVANLLQQAREALLQTPVDVAQAEKLTMQAQGLLKRREDSRRWGSTYGALILGYEFLFFLAFAAVLAFDQPLAAWVGTFTGAASAVSMRDILPFWDTMIWGGIGGVLGALYSLYWHVTEKQDFDRQFNMWYVVQPVMGSMLGAFIYLIVLSGMLAMNTGTTTASIWFPSAIACLSGFRQKFIFELLDKLMEVIGLRPLLKKDSKVM